MFIYNKMKAHHPKKFYRFQIFSKDCLQNVQIPSGSLPTLTNGWMDSYYFIDIPTFLDGDRYQIAVESFNVNGNNTSVGYVVNCSSISQPNSYNTSTQCQSYALLNYNSSFFYHFIDFSSIGIPLKDLSFMRSKQIRIYLTGLDGNAISSTAFNAAGQTYWVMSLIVFPIEDEE